MNSICKYFPYVALMARYKQDAIMGNSDPTDYIKTTLENWHDEVKFFPFYPKYKYQSLFKKREADGFLGIIELKYEIIVACLGTDGLDEWGADVFGYFRAWKGLMHSGYGYASEASFNLIKDYLFENAGKKSPVFVGHSAGGPEACGIALLAAQKHICHGRVFAYNPPPGLTKKGVQAYKDVGLEETTTNIFAAHGDPVGIAGELKYNHVGSSLKLPPAKDEFMQKIPLGPHGYRSNFASLKEHAKKINDQEALDWLMKTEGVATI